MNKLLLIGFLAMMFIISACDQDDAPSYTVVDNSVLVDNADVYINVTPHHRTNSGLVYAEFESKIFSGNVDIAIGFIEDNGAKPTWLQYQHPVTEEWINLNPDGKIYHNYSDMDTWYYTTGLPINAEQRYKVRYSLNIPYGAEGKYTIAIKPSSETIPQAIENNHFYMLDPWFDFDLTNGLEGYYSFDVNVSSNNIPDDNGGLRNMSALGTAEYTTTNCKLGGGCYNFSDETDILLTPSYTMGDSGDNYTISSWVRTRTIAETNNIYGREFFTLLNHLDGNIEFKTGSGGSGGTWNDPIILSGKTIVTDIWFHIVLMKNATERSIWVNSTKVNSSTWDQSGVAKSFVLGCSAEDDANICDNNALAFKGSIDEFAVWNRSLTQAEIDGLYNGGDGLAFSLSTGLNTTNISQHTITPTSTFTSSGSMNCSALINTTSQKNYNVTINWTNSTDFISQSIIKDKLPATYQSFNVSDTFVAGEIYNCTMFAHERDNQSINVTSSITNTILQTIPVWTVKPTNKTIFFTENISLDYDCIDPDGAVSYGITNINVDFATPITLDSVNGNISGSPIQTDLGGFDYNMTCEQGGVNISQILNITVNDPIGNNQSALRNLVGEGINQTFFLNLNITNFTIAPSDVLLQFNGSQKESILIDSGTSGDISFYNYSSSFVIPSGAGSGSGLLQQFNWTLNLSNEAINYETNSTNITIIEVGFDSCTTFNHTILNFTLFDEKNNTISPNAGSNIDVELTVVSYDNLSLEFNFSQNFTNHNNASICVPEGLLNQSSYKIDVTAQYNSLLHVAEFWYLDVGNLSILDSFNSFTNKTVNLLNLETIDSTSFLFNYFNIDGLAEEDTIVLTWRKFIGAGTFREVERSKADNSGDTIIHVVEEDVIYFFTITQNGTVLFVSNQFNVLCQELPCELVLNEGSDFVPFSQDWDLVADGAYSKSVDSTARTVTLTFATTQNTNWTLQLFSYNNNPENATIVNQSSLKSTSGTIVVGVPPTAGNTTYVARIKRDNAFLQDSYVGFGSKLLDKYRSAGGIVLGALVVLTFGLIAVTEGIAFVVFVVIGFIFVGIMKLFEFNWEAFVSLLIMVALLIWKLSTTRGRR